MLNRAVASAALAALFVSSAVFAQAAQPTQSVPATNTNVGDPNEKICETITPIGSRLATKRFCGTRAEWADRKLQDKQALERAQMGPCVLQTTSASGRPSC